MKAGIILLLMTVCSSSFATDPHDANKLNGLGDSLATLSDFIDSTEMLLWKHHGQKNYQPGDYQGEDIGELALLNSRVSNLLFNCALFSRTYAQGANNPSCLGIQWNLNLLELEEKELGFYHILVKDILPPKLAARSESTIIISKTVWEYIRDNIPDSCEKAIE